MFMSTTFELTARRSANWTMPVVSAYMSKPGEHVGVCVAPVE